MKKQITLLPYNTYLAVIKNSVDSDIFRNLYAKIDGKKVDIVRNGNLSCAFYVSSVLTIFQLIPKPHGTVEGTIKDLVQSGWNKLKTPKIGSVLVWEELNFNDGEKHKHIGFYIGDNKAISNSEKLGQPKIHHWTYGTIKRKPVRKVEAIYWNKKYLKIK